MKIVIDIGCARYGGDYSIERLLEQYAPDWLYGFDPAWTADMYKPSEGCKTIVHVSTEAAWTFDGRVRFLIDGLNGQVGDAEHWPLVPCVDLARFIDELPRGELILKLDAEGSEIDLLEHLIATQVDMRLSSVVVEWHPANDPKRRAAIERKLTCPLEEWGW